MRCVKLQKDFISRTIPAWPCPPQLARAPPWALALPDPLLTPLVIHVSPVLSMSLMSVSLVLHFQLKFYFLRDHAILPVILRVQTNENVSSYITAHNCTTLTRKLLTTPALLNMDSSGKTSLLAWSECFPIRYVKPWLDVEVELL